MALLRWCYGKLRLTVNETKSAVAGVTGRKFLGYSFWAELAAKGEVVSYHSIRFLDGQKIEGIRCMISGITPKAAPRRKSKVAQFN
jgi:RNA-directed DNA polymerase